MPPPQALYDSDESTFIRKILAPIKIKSALPPPPPNPKYPPPKTRNFMDMGFSCRTDAFFPGVHKIGAAISGPRIADTNFTDTRIFLILADVWSLLAVLPKNSPKVVFLLGVVGCLEAQQRHFSYRAILRGQKVGYGMVVDGIAKFQALKFTFQSLKFPVKSPILLV